MLVVHVVQLAAHWRLVWMGGYVAGMLQRMHRVEVAEHVRRRVGWMAPHRILLMGDGAAGRHRLVVEHAAEAVRNRVNGGHVVVLLVLHLSVLLVMVQLLLLVMIHGTLCAGGFGYD